MNIVKKTYHWVLGWADSRFGTLALFVLALVESVFFPVPPDVLLIALALGATTKAFRYALVCTIGSVSGAVIGYAVGHFVWLQSNGDFTAFAEFFFRNIPGFTHELFNNVRQLFEKWNFWIVFTAGFTPVPYKVFTISAGVFDVDFAMFMIASVVSRGARFFLVSWLIWRYGKNIKGFIDKYFNWLALSFTVLLITGFWGMKYLI